MSGTLGDVVARLYAARERLLAAAVTANRAQADAEQAAGHYTEAAQGSNDQLIKTAISGPGISWQPTTDGAGVVGLADHDQAVLYFQLWEVIDGGAFWYGHERLDESLDIGKPWGQVVEAAREGRTH